jgi:hypothetical protein
VVRAMGNDITRQKVNGNQINTEKKSRLIGCRRELPKGSYIIESTVIFSISIICHMYK